MINDSRPAINFAKKLFGDKEITAIEIGVKFGINAERIMNNLNVKKIYLIDPYKGKDRIDQRLFNLYKDKAHKTLISQKIVWIEKPAHEALDFINEKIDFCYIDGSHQYLDVLQDITNYYNIVKVGGIISGHDYDAGNSGVKKAVDEYFSGMDFTYKLGLPDDESPRYGIKDWYHIKVK
jgi:predicted O-methyltransferase YrrM